MEYVAAYYTNLLAFMGNHPVFCFFTFPMWAIALLLPFLLVSEILEHIVSALKWMFK